MRATPTFKSLTLPVLTGGAERVPMVLTGGVCASLAVGAWFTWSLVSAALSLAIMLCVWPLLRRMATKDPMMVTVCTRFIAYKRYYPARTPASPWRV